VAVPYRTTAPVADAEPCPATVALLREVASAVTAPEPATFAVPETMPPALAVADPEPVTVAVAPWVTVAMTVPEPVTELPA
jgi:hypothetical protein